jgi:hypothetical protein
VGMREAFAQMEEDFKREEKEFWDSFTKDEQLLLFCHMTRLLVQGELIEQRSYRGMLYSIFGFDESSYLRAQLAGYFDIHNALDTGD